MQRALFQEAVSAPWKAVTEVRRFLAFPWIRGYFLLMGVPWNRHWRIYGFPLIQRYRGSQIYIGHHLQMRSWFSSNPLGINHRCVLATRAPQARIEIGDNVGLTATTICAENTVTIGSHVRIGANTSIIDTDFHPVNPQTRLVQPRRGENSPIVIEDDVFVGMSVLILKGSYIGSGTTIGAGSVVTGRIPPNVVAAGNPVRVIKKIDVVN